MPSTNHPHIAISLRTHGIKRNQLLAKRIRQLYLEEIWKINLNLLFSVERVLKEQKDLYEKFIEINQDMFL